MILTSEVLLDKERSKVLIKGIFTVVGIIGASIGLFFFEWMKSIICTLRNNKCTTRNNNNKSNICRSFRKRDSTPLLGIKGIPYTLQGIKVFQKVIREKYNYESQVASPTSVSKGRGKKKSNRRVARKAEFVSANYTGVTLTTL